LLFGAWNFKDVGLQVVVTIQQDHKARMKLHQNGTVF
jgi:hypothetical protein